MTLTYDMTFLAILLSGLYERTAVRSGTLPWFIHAESTRFFPMNIPPMPRIWNILLAYHKCMDDWLDKEKPLETFLCPASQKRYKTLEARYPRQVQAINIYMENVHNGEKMPPGRFRFDFQVTQAFFLVSFLPAERTNGGYLKTDGILPGKMYLSYGCL